METTQNISSFDSSAVQSFFKKNKVTLSLVGAGLLAVSLVTFFTSSRGKRFFQDVASTANDLAEEVQKQMMKESSGKILKERSKVKEMA